MKKQIAAYLEEQLIYLVQEEAYYLQEGLGWAIRRIRGEAPVEENFEPEPSESLDEFLMRERK